MHKLKEIADNKEQEELANKILESLNSHDRSQLEHMIIQYGTVRFFEGVVFLLLDEVLLFFRLLEFCCIFL